MLHQGCADIRAAVKQKREDSFRQAALSNAFSNHLPDKFACTRMRRMRLDDHRIPRCERGSGIPSRYGESQREVTRSEHDDWAQRTQHGTDIWLGGGLALGVGSVNPRGNPRTLLGCLCKQPELSASARSLTLQARLRQSSFHPSAFDYVTGDGLYLRRDLAQEGTALRSWHATITGKGLGREESGKLYFFGSCRNVSRLQRSPVSGIHGVERLSGTVAVSKPNQ